MKGILLTLFSFVIATKLCAQNKLIYEDENVQSLFFVDYTLRGSEDSCLLQYSNNQIISSGNTYGGDSHIYGNLLHKRSTANCYVIRSAGGYMLPLIYGNAIKDGEFNTAAYTSEGKDHQAAFVNHLGNLITGPYIEDHAGCEAKDAVVVWEESQGLITGLKLVEGDTCRELEFKVNTVPATGGNAVIAVRDNNAAIIWSWHIWLYPDNLATEKLTNHTGVEYDVLPVPIGWTWQNANKERGRNVFFQWGRKDPMPSPLNYNGTERSNLSGLITTLTKSATPAASVAEAIKNPHTFFVQDETNHNDWQSAAEFRYNHWDASLNAAGASDAPAEGAPWTDDDFSDGEGHMRAGSARRFSAMNVRRSAEQRWAFFSP